MGKIKFTATIIDFINFAMQQNGVPLFREIHLSNQDEEKSGTLKLEIKFEPDFADEITVEIPPLESGEMRYVGAIGVNLKSAYLLSLTEAINATVDFKLLESTEDGLWNILHRDTLGVELGAYNQWTGLGLMPEMIAAFVTPNTPLVHETVLLASKYMQKWTGDPAFFGYQKDDPNSVLTQMAAVYAALQEKNIAYNMPPASFGIRGQRVRLPDEVLTSKQGTCLDLATLYASCLEAVGLFPILVFTLGHAFIGCWLEETISSEMVNVDLAELTKRSAEGIYQIALVECTVLTAGKNDNFDHARRLGADHLSDPTKFMLSVDIQRCRGAAIRPIPLKVDENQKLVQVDYGKRTGITGKAKTVDWERYNKEGEVRERSRVDVWSTSLLDLTLRNNLLSFRVTKNTLQLTVNKLGRLEDALADGQSFQLREKPTDWESTLRDSKIHELNIEQSLIDSLVDVEFKGRRLRTFLTRKELDRVSKSIYRSSKHALEENGSNSLYLSLGFLRWYEDENSDRQRYAPLVLVPIEIITRAKTGNFYIKMLDEETRFNITLLEYLRVTYGIDIPGLDPLPFDESGVDLELIFSWIRKAIMDKPRWEVDEMAFIGLFSFNQFVMWNDLNARMDEVGSHPVVKALLEGKLEDGDTKEIPSLDIQDQKIRPDEIGVVSSIDSTQLQAVIASGLGEHFVLHGPPGTGKSQVITNIIAHALFQGKRVLFVAEKVAALRVVFDRLEKLGLGAFCLELHSNKAQKKHVLSQLEKVLNQTKERSPEQFTQRANEIMAMREKMNKEVDHLHRIRKSGYSFYDFILMHSMSSDKDIGLKLPIKHLKEADPAQFERWDNAINRMTHALQALGVQLHEHPLKEFMKSSTNILLRQDWRHKYPEILRKVKSLDDFEQKWNGSELRNMVNLWSELAAADHKINKHLVDEPVALRDFSAALTSLNELDDELLEKYNKEILAQNPRELILAAEQAKGSFFLTRKSKIRQVAAKLRLDLIDSSMYTDDEILSDLPKLLDRQRRESETIEKRNAVIKYLPSEWHTKLPDRDELIRYISLHRKIHEQTKKIKTNIESVLASMPTKTVIDNLNTLLEEIEDFSEHFEIDVSKIMEGENWRQKLESSLQRWDSNLQRWEEIANYRQATQILVDENLSEVVAQLESSEIAPADIKPAFHAALSIAMIRVYLEESELLRNFNGIAFEHLIDKYKQTAKEFEELTKHEIRARLAANVPDISRGAQDSSELGILLRAIRSGGRGQSLRTLFQKIPNMISRLTPCMLMSPLSVAQYIDPSYPKFDLVVFDEASQIPTSDSVGAISRGNQLIVVGDPNQLPPTRFFAAQTDEDESFDITDLESILDDCIAIPLPQRHLLWHYRSRHESLIEFSNNEYYESKLMTYPTPTAVRSRISFNKLDGIYDRGKTRTNEIEAKAVVKEIVRRLSDPQLRKKSIGVVTFNAPQQNYIDDLMNEEFKKHPELDDFNQSIHEPLFIKNLESVQGDERDIILFSIGFGPDEGGNFTMNFGPLNKSGGWRRLNVAVSRAREEMIIFSSIDPDQIDLKRTMADGVKGLKHFLEFAKSPGQITPPETIYDSELPELEEIIASQLISLGYQLDRYVGNSDYRVPIAIKDPDHEGRYLLGILLDSAADPEKETSRDRHIQQPDFLNYLGWRILRVWSLDWLNNPSEVIRKIEEAYQEEKEKYKEKPKVEEIPPQPKEIKPLTFQKSEDYVIKGYEENIQMQAQRIATQAPNQEVTRDKVFKVIPYEHWSTDDNYSMIDIYSDEAIQLIYSFLFDILLKEAPIQKEYLFKKALVPFNIGRLGSRIRSIMEDVLDGIDHKKDHYDENTVWHGEQVTEHWRVIRISDDEDKRSIPEIPRVELMNACLHTLHNQLSMEEEDLIRAVANLFGFNRIGRQIRERLSEVIDQLREEEKIRINGGRVEGV